MGTLNPDLLSKDLDVVLNDAVVLKDQYKKPVLMPELLLLALLRSKDTAAARLLDSFKNSRGIDLDRLIRQTELAVESRRDQDGNLEFIAAGNRHVPLSRQTIILIDDALSLANAQNEVRVDTDHALAVLAETTISTSGLLRQHGITPKAIADLAKPDKLPDVVSQNADINRAEVAILKAMPYSEYLKTPHWKKTSQQALERARYRCQVCNTKENLNVHHNTYEHLGEEQSDLSLI